MDIRDQPCHVLWTGGWDSTYRVLDLLVSHKVLIQPHYIVDLDRPSTYYELKAIGAVRQWALANITTAEQRILPPKIVFMEDVPQDDDVSARYEGLRRNGHLGSQYDMLSRYASLHGGELELSIHRDDVATSFLTVETSMVSRRVDGKLAYWALVEHPQDQNLELFRPFRFPLFDLTKVDMKSKARELGFLEALELSWFCYTPRGGRPCGRCNPCKYTIEEGMGYRVPLLGHGVYWTKRIVKSILK